jgi:hypothetical protein
MRPIRALLLALVALLVCAPAAHAAYTIVLKGGEQIEARSKYTVRDGRAYIVLPSGTETYIDAAEIDVAATERANAVGRGGALVIDEGEAREIEERDTARREENRPRLSDLITSRDSTPRPPEPARRRTPPPAPETTRTTRTTAGFTDLRSLARRPLSDSELVSAVRRFYRGQEVETLDLYQGTRADRPFVEITTNSEASVFRALEVSAEALLALRADFPDVAALEILLMTPDRERAGQFVMTPELAQELADEQVTVARFFLDNVQF